jgi:hypothetical protein
MDATVVTYLIYLLISVSLTVWVAQTLHRNGQLFLVDVFNGNQALARSVNHLLVVGFYLINLGYVTLALRLGDEVGSAQASIEALSVKVGGVLLVLGVMHFGNMFVLSRIRRRGRLDQVTLPPVPATGWTPPAQTPPQGYATYGQSPTAEPHGQRPPSYGEPQPPQSR